MFIDKKKIANYLGKDFKHDLLSGIVVGLVALPLAIAFAIASGVEPQRGLYTAIIAGVIGAIFSGSNYQVSGPTGAFIVILLSIVNNFGVEGLLTAGFMAGIILILMGLFRFGSVIKFIPYPVTVGFTSGIAVIIFVGQIKNFLGLSFEKSPHDFFQTIMAISNSLSLGLNYYSILVGVITLSVYMIWAKCNRKFPPAPVALAAGIFSGLFFIGKISSVGSIPSGLPNFQMISLNYEYIKILLPSAFTIAMLGAIESLLSAVVADGMTGTRHDSNKELIAQGIGNIVTPLFGGIPATGAIARTATNIKNGAKTKISTLVHAIVLLLIVMFFSNYTKIIPLSALAAILMVVAYNMSEITHFKSVLKAPKRDSIVLLVTFFTTIFLDLTVAVSLGVVLAAVLFIKRVSEINVVSLEENAKAGSEGSKRLHISLDNFPGISLYEINGPLFFGAATIMQERIDYKGGKILIIRMKHVDVVDATGLHAIDLIISRVKNNGGQVILATVQPQVVKHLFRTGIVDHLGGKEFIVESSTEAIEKAKKILLKKK